ncbi:MAG: 2OG-Fe(II) oxygenase [Pirellulales bacterium]|nr:2OG-Fe(II) oxygenase [Pirellulales bacterium]
MLIPLEPVPWFSVRSTINPRFHFDTVAGRYLVLCFFRSAADPGSRLVLDEIQRHSDCFDVNNAAFLGVSTDPDDERLARVKQESPGIVFFWDFDQAVSRLCGASAPDREEYQRFTAVIDPNLRTIAVLPFGADLREHVARLLHLLAALPKIETLTGFAPVLVVPRVFEPDFCRFLIGQYQQHGGQDSGFMRDIEGQTVRVSDYGHKRRTDYEITDQNIVRAAQQRLQRRLVPEIHKAFQFHATRIERHIVACYDAATGGHFRAHRDNTTKGTAHRRFAVSLNLNSDEYKGGDICFPEFGPRSYRAPTGGAVVFSCSLLHEVSPVVQGKRYAFLPFLYDEAAARVRQENLAHLTENNTPAPG